MQELTPQQKKKLLKLAKLADEGNLAIAEHLFEIEEKMEAEIPEIKDIISRVKGDKGDIGPKPIKGKDYLTDEDMENIKKELTPQKGVHYFDGKDGRTPMFIGKAKPNNPQKGDLWYQD